MKKKSLGNVRKVMPSLGKNSKGGIGYCATNVT